MQTSCNIFDNEYVIQNRFPEKKVTTLTIFLILMFLWMKERDLDIKSLKGVNKGKNLIKITLYTETLPIL